MKYEINLWIGKFSGRNKPQHNFRFRAFYVRKSSTKFDFPRLAFIFHSRNEKLSVPALSLCKVLNEMNEECVGEEANKEHKMEKIGEQNTKIDS